MRCYASIDRIERNFAVFEVDLFLLEDEECKLIGHEITDTVMVDIPLQEIPADIGEVGEGDILIVEYEKEEGVTTIYSKDEEEKARRLKLLKELMDW